MDGFAGSGLAEGLTSELTLEWGEEAGRGKFWWRAVRGRGNSRCKGLEAGGD